MNSWIVLLRGINVGGNRIVKMKILAEALTANGFVDVVTILQSGNVVFASSDREAVMVEARFSEVMQSTFGFEPHLAIISATDWSFVTQNNPFVAESETAGNWVQVYFGSTEEERQLATAFAASYPGVEKIEVVGTHIYSYFPEGIGTSELARDRTWNKITKSMTARNWNTVVKIAACIGG